MKRWFAPKGDLGIELNDYVIRALHRSTKDASFDVYEAPVPPGLVVQGEIDDTAALQSFLKETFDTWGVPRSETCFFVSDEAILTRPIEMPAESDYPTLDAFVAMELGQTIHVPFDVPSFDVFPTNEEETKGVLFAVPSEPVHALADTLNTMKYVPKVADVRMLSLARVLERIGYLHKNDEAVLVVDWSLNGLSAGIFRNYELEFLRFQQFPRFREHWSSKEKEMNMSSFATKELPYQLLVSEEEYIVAMANEFAEIGRLMNSYRFTLHNGEVEVQSMIVTGDHPLLDTIEQQLKEMYYGRIRQIRPEDFTEVYGKYPLRFASLVGLYEREDIK